MTDMAAPPDAPHDIYVADIRPAGVNRRVILHWPPVPGAVAYQVRLAGVGGAPVRVPVTDDTAAGCAIDVTPGTWLVAQVAAVDATGLVSEFSPLVEVTVD